MKLSAIILGLAAAAMSAPADVRGIKLGYAPTTNKHIAKRQKRKVAKRSGSKPSTKPHNQRNKKGRP